MYNITAFNLDDIALIPRVISEIGSRRDIDTSIMLDNYLLQIPIIASPMKDVCNGEFGDKLIKNGCYGFTHRFCDINEHVIEFSKNKKLGSAIGINGDALDRFRALCDTGCTTFCIDVANGANILIQKFIDKLININNKVKFIIGNVASRETFLWTSKISNVIGVRVGISGGKACTTKHATGIFHPMASLLMECKFVKKDGMPLIIADGGIKGPEDFCKAIALGADCVMLGSVLASANDSPAELIKRDKVFYKVYHGSSSFEIQSLYRKKPKYIEGKTALLDFDNENLEQIITRFSDGLRSSMSYMNAKTIKEYQLNTNFTIIK